MHRWCGTLVLLEGAVVILTVAPAGPVQSMQTGMVPPFFNVGGPFQLGLQQQIDDAAARTLTGANRGLPPAPLLLPPPGGWPLPLPPVTP